MLARIEMRDFQSRSPSSTYWLLASGTGEGEEDEREEREEDEREEEEEREESKRTILLTSLVQIGSISRMRRHLICVSWHS
jgi:TATA-binding protein-associated factor Taf7